jgi:hypothetical protein
VFNARNHLEKEKALMSSESVTTGDSIYGGKYAQDTKGNIGRGNTESAALSALQAAQAASNSNDKK